MFTGWDSLHQPHPTRSKQPPVARMRPCGSHLFGSGQAAAVAAAANKEELAIIVQAFDPEIVIVLGGATASWRHWSFGFEPALRSALPPTRRGVPVSAEPWQDISWAQGAASLVFATPFDTEGIAGSQGEMVRQRMFGRALTAET